MSSLDKPYQYNNILVVPMGGLYVPGSVLVLSWDRINKPLPGQVTSLGVYNETRGIEWCIDPESFVQEYTACEVGHKKAVCHWIFDYVINDSFRKYIDCDRLKFKDLAAKGEYATIFSYLYEMLNKVNV